MRNRDDSQWIFVVGSGELDLSGEPDAFVLLTLPTPNLGAAYDVRAEVTGRQAAVADVA